LWAIAWWQMLLAENSWGGGRVNASKVSVFALWSVARRKILLGGGLLTLSLLV
jgi:hypothetical protein